MADVFTREQRSLVMRKVKSRGNAATEIKLLKPSGRLALSGGSATSGFSESQILSSPQNLLHYSLMAASGIAVLFMEPSLLAIKYSGGINWTAISDVIGSGDGH